MKDRIKCCYPECTQDATHTGAFGAEVGDEVLGQVPLCEEHFNYVQDPEHKKEVDDLFGPPLWFLPILTRDVKELWANETL
jgi:hypothetical protein